jgi:hypothetical protein
MNQTDSDILTLVDPDTFWDNVEVGDPFSCWPWLDGMDDKGYGVVMVRDGNRIRGFKAHRVAYLLANDDSLGDYLVCHHCDNPPCCNPRCLFKGTDQDNQWDRVIKQNERKVITKFREQLLDEYLKGVDARDLSKQYGVTTTYIKLIIKSTPQAQLDDLRLKRQNRERALAGLPPRNGHTLSLPPAIGALGAAFHAHEADRLPTRMVLEHANRDGANWTAWSLPAALREECTKLSTAPLKTVDTRSELSAGRTVKHYLRADLHRVMEALG